MRPLITIPRNSRLQTWRRKQRLSLGELSDLTGMSPAMLSRAERGERQLSRQAKVLIARRLGVPIRYLFPVKPVPDPDPTEKAKA